LKCVFRKFGISRPPMGMLLDLGIFPDHRQPFEVV
jgi:hypothetical protein